VQMRITLDGERDGTPTAMTASRVLHGARTAAGTRVRGA
jgi:hypothetical protein